MPSENNNIETLKFVLENSLHPKVLDSHPWTKSLIVLETVADTPELKNKTPGQQLVITVANYFTQMMPTSAPRRGKRLDTSWGEFGILAAQYFAPLLFGTPTPSSLRDAWGRIDQSILLFVFGKPNITIPQEKKDTYKLVGGESEVAANSTLSDWHRKGLQQLVDMLSARERFLSGSNGIPAVIADGNARKDSRPSSKTNIRLKQPRAISTFFIAIVIILLALIALGAFKAQKIYTITQVVREDVTYIQKLLAEPDDRLGRFKNIGSAVSILRKDFDVLKSEAQPFFWMSPMLRWVPVRGGDIASIEDLTTLADSVLTSADLSYQAVSSLVDNGELAGVSPTELTAFLKKNQPQLSRAQQSLKQAEIARARLKPENLSSEVRDLILNDVDPLMRIMQDGLTIAVELPIIMGAGNEGSKTYLLLVQNEDELRPTGGFITAASAILMQDGNIGDLNFVNSGDLDNWYKIYPAAPWQLNEYMNSQVLIFRDANWFTDYPTTALYAQYLYSYTNNRSVNGVIAFDQHFLVEILGVTGAIQLEDTPYPIDTNNIVQYMRESKTPNAQEASSPNWNNKAFLNKITYALLQKLLSGEIKWELISTMLLRALNEHHLLLQVDNPDMTILLARYHWDGAVKPGTGDFLMAVDTNIGFNKTSGMVESSLVYDVDLTDPASPAGSLTVNHKNNVAKNIVCKHWLKDHADGEEGYPVTDCYWNYLRIYKSLGTALISASPQVVPDIWMINKQTNPGQVNILNEDTEGVQTFGTLQVIPSGESLPINFQFALPANVLQIDNQRMTYTLNIQKQPGTLAVPITLRVHLPNNASIETMPPGAVVQENSILYETDLRTDFEFSIVFSIP